MESHLSNEKSSGNRPDGRGLQLKAWRTFTPSTAVQPFVANVCDTSLGSDWVTPLPVPCTNTDQAAQFGQEPMGHPLLIPSSHENCHPNLFHKTHKARFSWLSPWYVGMVTLVLWTFFFSSGCHAAPTEPPRTAMDGLSYLQTFGYLPASDKETGMLRTSEELVRSISALQRMGNIPQTGKFDNATRELIGKPRCGVRDIGLDDDGTGRSKRAIGPSKWDHKAITFRIMGYSRTSQLGQASQRQAIYDAFHMWMAVTQLTFHEVMQGDADMMIDFERYHHGDGFPFDGLGVVLAHAFFPGRGLGGDVHFDDDEHWTLFVEEGTNLLSVAAHEIGHALGLRHSDVPGALMNAWYQGYMEDFHLHPDDISSIQYLYGYKRVTQRPDSSLPGVTVPPPTLPPMPPSTPGTRLPLSTTPSPTQPQGQPDPCIVGFDALSVIRTELYAFKGNWFWRFNDDGLLGGFPVELNRFWYGLPKHITSVDAVYEREKDGLIFFFSGNRYWIFASNVLRAGFPEEGKALIHLGFPSYVDHVDAAFIWGHNQMTYFISDDIYFRYNEDGGYMEHDYPRGMHMWRGVPVPIDSAFQHWDGRTYFFKGSNYYLFNDALMKVKSGYPKPIGSLWLSCEIEYSPNDGGVKDASKTNTGSQTDHDRDDGDCEATGTCGSSGGTTTAPTCISLLVLTWTMYVSLCHTHRNI